MHPYEGVRSRAGTTSWGARAVDWLPSSPLSALLYAACVVALVFFVALPLAGIAWQSFRAIDGSFTLANYTAFFTSSRMSQAAINTLLVSGLAVLVR